MARFTPDGRHVLVNAIYGDGEVLDGGMGAPAGTVASVRVAAERAPDGTPRHRLVSRAQTRVLPEGLNINPNGRWVVTANLERSTAAPADPRQGFFASLTLLRLDPATGLLERVGDFALDGMLPEMAVFDNSSRYLAATTFAHFDPARPSRSGGWRRTTSTPGRWSWSNRTTPCPSPAARMRW